MNKFAGGPERDLAQAVSPVPSAGRPADQNSMITFADITSTDLSGLGARLQVSGLGEVAFELPDGRCSVLFNALDIKSLSTGFVANDVEFNALRIALSKEFATWRCLM